MKLTKYNNYKNTNIHWLGNIPEHWEVKRIKQVFSNFGSGTTPKSSNEAYYEGGTINWLNTSDLNNDYIENTKFKISEIALKELSLRLYPANTLAIAMYGQGKTRGTVGLLKVPSTTNQASCMMYGTKIANEKFILWWFIHKYEDIRFINIGATQPNMNQDFVRQLLLQLPPLSEQTAIANYLDQKTAQIDRKVDLLSQKIEKYKELKKSLINETVCRGLDKNVNLKPSGIDWIGDIPEHWEVKRGKEVLNVMYGIPLNSAKFTNNSNEGFPLIRIRDLNNQEVQTYYTGEIDRSGLVKNGAILTGMDGDFQTVKWYGGEALLNQRICQFKPTRFTQVNFLHYFIPLAIRIINETKFFTTVKHLSDADLKVITILLPPLQEQTAITQYLDEKTNKIDQITANLSQQITALKELRKTLINEVVTGKVRVID